jgi:hypothetical protein
MVVAAESSRLRAAGRPAVGADGAWTGFSAEGRAGTTAGEGMATVSGTASGLPQSPQKRASFCTLAPQ